MLTNFWKSYIASCDKTYEDLGNMLVFLCRGTIGLHVFYFVLNKSVDGTEEIWLRLAAVCVLAPSLTIRLISREWLPSTLISGLLISGPVFMLTSAALELTKPEINQSYLILLEYEYLATIALCLISFTNPKPIAIVNLAFFLLATLWVLPKTSLSVEALPLVFLPFLSLWFPVVLAGAYFLEKKSLLLAKKAETLNTISSSMAHELRTPLAGIRNFAIGLEKRALRPSRNDLDKSESTGNELTNYEVNTYGKITQLAEQANTIINMLLISSKDYEESKATFEEMSAHNLIEASIASFPYNNDHEASLIHYIPGSDFSANGPQPQLVHVILNLLKNAVRYSQRNKSVQVLISINAKDRTISVLDDGPGISLQVRKKIYDRFYTTEKYGQGTGIGLSFCKMTMESIGGSIDCESVLGEYTKFTLKFP